LRAGTYTTTAVQQQQLGLLCFPALDYFPWIVLINDGAGVIERLAAADEIFVLCESR
jgi:hypothetical protein